MTPERRKENEYQTKKKLLKIIKEKTKETKNGTCGDMSGVWWKWEIKKETMSWMQRTWLGNGRYRGGFVSDCSLYFPVARKPPLGINDNHLFRS